MDRKEAMQGSTYVYICKGGIHRVRARCCCCCGRGHVSSGTAAGARSIIRGRALLPPLCTTPSAARSLSLPFTFAGRPPTPLRGMELLSLSLSRTRARRLPLAFVLFSYPSWPRASLLYDYIYMYNRRAGRRIPPFRVPVARALLDISYIPALFSLSSHIYVHTTRYIRIYKANRARVITTVAFAPALSLSLSLSLCFSRQLLGVESRVRRAFSRLCMYI